MRLASWIIGLASWIVPADQRSEWRREWLAELQSRAQTPGGSALASMRFAFGAPRHALWLRRDAWRPALLAADVRFGFRQVRRRPGLATAAILTIAIGAGATTAIFSVVYGVLLKPLPYRQPERLVQLWESNPLFNWTEAAIAPGNLLSWKERSTSFSDIAFYFGSATREGWMQSLTFGAEEPERVRAFPVSTNFFDVLGVGPATGRTFVSGEDVTGRHRVVVLSDRFWKSRLGGDPGIAGRTMSLNGVPFEVVGVMPPDFRFDTVQPDFWIPLTQRLADQREVRRPHFYRAVARLKDGVTPARARAELAGIARDLEREHPDTNTQMSAGLGPVDDWLVGPSRQPLLLFFAAVGLVLLVGCVNVANLLIARSFERAAEIRVRAALGASRARLVRQLLIESLAIASLGSALGLVIAAAGVKLFVASMPVDLPRAADAGIDVTVLGFCLALTVLTTLLVGLMPAVLGARTSLRDAIGAGGRLTTSRARVRRVLVATEVALACVLVVGAALAVRSFTALVSVDHGLPAGEQVSGRISLPSAGYGATGRAAAFFEDVSARLRAVPGVVAAGAVAQLPLEGASWGSQFFISSRPEFHGYDLRHKAVTSGYLEALGVRLIAGRTLTSADRAGAPLAVVANETFVRRFFPEQNPIGQRLTWDPPGKNVFERVIVGVVSDEPQDAIGLPAVPEVYYSLMQEGRTEMAVLVRSALPPDRVVAAMRQVVRDVDPALAIFDVGPMTARVDRALATARAAAWLVSGFAAVALLLAIVGIYGVTAWAASARRREFGIRMACGATRADVFRLVLRQDLRVLAAGLLAGVALASIAARLAGSLLFGVTPADVTSFAIGSVFLTAAGVIAAIGPARRAAGVDPASVMRLDG